jgi:hypothetical protein
MKRFAILFAATTIVAGCSDTESEPAPEPTESAVAEVVVGGLAIDGKPNVGTYDITSADGTVINQTVNPDGTLIQVQGDETLTGTWTSSGPGNWCIKADGATEEKCYIETISEDGVYTSTNVADPSDSWTVQRTS